MAPSVSWRPFRFRPSMLNLNRILLGRLLVSWLLISAVIGGVVAYVGIERIDDQLVALATADSTRLSSGDLQLINSPSRNEDALQRLMRDLMRDHFVVVELYNSAREKVLEQVNPNFESVEDYLKQHPHGFPFDGRPHYERFMVGGQAVLQVMVPLTDAKSAAAGYFEGVFIIDPETLARLRRELATSLLTILAVILLTTFALYPVIVSLNREVLRHSHDLLQGNIELMEVLGSAVAKRDSDTSAHNYRVSIYAVKLAEAAGLPPERVRDLIGGAFLHDVGKIGISDVILLKPGRLDEREFSVMKTHVALGVDILQKSNWLQRARDVVEFHHEKYDGSGYLKGLSGEDIPVTARIFAIVDVFDALTSKRPYKEPFPFREAMAIIQGSAGSHFDPRLVAVFAGMIEPLFAQLGQLGDAGVEAMLRAMIARYFLPVAASAA
ncbi:MAG TPA: HD-GYP domain-containing protein [Rhodocyclaceae bacterium]